MTNFGKTQFGQIRLGWLIRLVGISILISYQLSCFVYSTANPKPDYEFDQLDPEGVVSVYWRSALIGDLDTIKEIAGLPHQTMLWDCPPKPASTTSKGTFHDLSIIDPRIDESLEKPVNHIESMLIKAKAIGIAGRDLGSSYNLAEYKSSGSEARLLFRPKDSPNTTNSTVFFLLKEGGRWLIVDIKAESQLQSVGNKKFGEPRTCPE